MRMDCWCLPTCRKVPDASLSTLMAGVSTCSPLPGTKPLWGHKAPEATMCARASTCAPPCLAALAATAASSPMKTATGNTRWARPTSPDWPVSLPVWSMCCDKECTTSSNKNGPRPTGSSMCCGRLPVSRSTVAPLRRGLHPAEQLWNHRAYRPALCPTHPSRTGNRPARHGACQPVVPHHRRPPASTCRCRG